MAIEKVEANTSGITVFDHRVSAQRIYQQYRSKQWLRDYAALIDNFIQEEYFNALEMLWGEMNVATSMHPYLTFYTKWLFGLYRPLAGASLSEFYDTGLSYDTQKIYDDAVEANGLITDEQYLKYIKFVCDYTAETWTIDYIIDFILNYCSLEDSSQILIDYDDKNEIKVLLPNSDATQEFVKLELNYRDAMGLPFGNVISFQINLDIENLKRFRIYSPFLNGWNTWWAPELKQEVNNYTIPYEVGSKFVTTGIKDDYTIPYAQAKKLR